MHDFARIYPEVLRNLYEEISMFAIHLTTTPLVLLLLLTALLGITIPMIYIAVMTPIPGEGNPNSEDNPESVL